MRRIVVAAVLFFSCLCLDGNVWGQAQITTGVIQGSVLDEKGLGVPGADVEARNLDTNLSKTAMTGPEAQ